MDLAQRVHMKLEKILMRLKALKIIHNYELKINFCDIEESVKGNLKLVDSVLKKCLKRIINKPKRAEIRNIISELVRKKNLNYVSDQSFEDPVNSEPENHPQLEPSPSPESNTKPDLIVEKVQKKSPIGKTVSVINYAEKNPGKYLCEKCGKTFQNAWDWKNHEETHSSSIFQCQWCSSSFPSLEELHRHRAAHKSRTIMSATDRPKSPPVFQPEKSSCLSPLKPANLNTKVVHQYDARHERGSNLRLPTVKLGSLSRKEKKVKALPPYICQCGKTFAVRKSFTKHQNLKHSETKTEFRCTHCQKTFFERGKLNRHMVSHVVADQYQCSHCSRRFARSDALKRHTLVAHDQIKNFACRFCRKKFTLKYNRDVHEENVHKTTDNWLRCELCHQRFKTKVTLKSHMEVHSGNRISCNLCNRIFAKKINYKNHMRKRHFGISPYQTLLDSMSQD